MRSEIGSSSRIGSGSLHIEAMAWVARHATNEPVTVLDLGGRDLNGSVRALWPHAAVYRVVDILPGDGVDIVADAAKWAPDAFYDVVVCCEVFEHTLVWSQIIETAYKACKPGGTFIATMAGPDRPSHSGIDGGPDLHPGEFYENIDPARLKRVLAEVGWEDIVVDQQVSPFPCDLRCLARKGQ